MTNKKVEVGMTFRSIIADCNALWEVIQKEGPNSWLCEVQNEKIEIRPGEFIDAEHVGTVRPFLTRDILRNVKFAEGLKNLIYEQEGFYQSLKPGQIVHYDHGFGKEWVRCEVVDQQFQDRPGKSIKPIALVGEWRKFDLPRRTNTGVVEYGHFGDMINKGEIFQPNVGSIYEGPTYVKRTPGIDPRKMEAIDLSVPAMTPEEIANAGWWISMGHVRKMVQIDDDPRKVLLTIKTYLEEVFK